jgi:type I restriction enzyme S subunit
MTEATTRGHWHIPWLRDLPEHWEVVSSKQLFSARKELAREKDQQLAATQAYGVISQKDFERRVGRRVVQITQNLEKRRHVERDDFVISMRSFQGGLERAWETGCIRSSYVVLKPSARVDVGFFQYLLKSHDYVQALQATSNFIRDGQDLNMSNFSLVDLPVPPKVEQRLLARFLDWHGARTAKLVRAKKKIIALLNEKQAIIHRAVTRGLDPNAKLKPSGIPWLGDVPEGWRVVSVGAASAIIQTGPFGSQLPASAYVSGGVPVINPSHLVSGSIEAEDQVSVSEEVATRLERHRFAVGDLAIARRGEIGRCSIVTEREAGWICGTGTIRLTPKDGVVSAHFLALLLSDPSLRAELKSASIGAAMDNLNEGMVGRLQIPLPPVSQQVSIVAFASEVASSSRQATHFVEREIALIQEVRTRLIADVVTGKLDVRAAAASLPETVELEPIDDLVEGDDLDEAIDATENEEVAA